MLEVLILNQPFVIRVVVKNRLFGDFKMRKYFCILITLLIYFSCKNKEISFIALNQFDNVDTIYSQGHTFINKQLYYIVDNYHDGDQVVMAIDSCAKAVAGENIGKFTTYTIIFYKSSDVTNVLNLKKNPRDIDRYSQENDLLFAYKWVNGKFAGKSY